MLAKIVSQAKAVRVLREAGYSEVSAKQLIDKMPKIIDNKRHKVRSVDVLAAIQLADKLPTGRIKFSKKVEERRQRILLERLK